MRMYNAITAATIGLAALVGCGSDKSKEQHYLLEGKPISVTMQYGYHSSIGTVIATEKQEVLAYIPCRNSNYQCAQGSALLEAQKEHGKSVKILGAIGRNGFFEGKILQVGESQIDFRSK